MNRNLLKLLPALALAAVAFPLNAADNPPAPTPPTASELIRRAEAASLKSQPAPSPVPAAPTIVDPIAMPSLNISPAAAAAAPAAVAAAPEAAAPSLEVSVLPSGSILAGGNVFPAENLTETFRKLATENPGKAVKIRATAATSQEKVAAVVAAARNAGIANVDISGAGSPPSAPPAPAPAPPSAPAPSAPMPPAAVELTLTKPESKPETKPEPAPVAPVVAPALPADVAVASHTIQAGDTFTSLAKKYYNDETRIGVIAQANPGVDSTRLKIGQVVKIPADLKAVDKQREEKLAEIGKAAEQSGSAQSVTIQSGDTLYKISKRVYGSSNYYKAIYEANKDKLKSPEQTLKVGMELKIPPKPAKP